MLLPGAGTFEKGMLVTKKSFHKNDQRASKNAIFEIARSCLKIDVFREKQGSVINSFL